ncbi:O-antigen ligase family protein [Geodermatophilus africanus]|nr:O-antigen ligase family protein [Geodermatophilus africanus]
MALFIFPSDMIIRAVGGQGYAASLIAFLLLVLWLLAVLFNRHDPLTTPHPTRGLLAFLVVTSLLSYAFLPFHRLTETERLSGDRWMMLLAATAGVALSTAELLPSLEALKKVLRALVLGAAISGVVAALQWLLRFDLAGVIRGAMPGFTLNSDYSTYSARGLLDRVTGTALHPIELGVVAGMVLPIAIALAMQQQDRPVLRKWGPVGLVALALPASVSRSALLSAVTGFVVFAFFLPRRQRITAFVLLPIGALAQFIVRPGYLGTLVGYVSQGGDDPSVATRLNDYELVEQLVSEKPLLGSGGGTYIASNAFDILDNQYLKGLIELGLLGATGLFAWLLLPALYALAARRRSADPRLRTIAAALAGSASSGAVCSATFDSLSFNMYAGVYALVVGAIGACWVLASREQPLPQSASLLQKG